jgi:xanthine dehydrogenase accessory factor
MIISMRDLLLELTAALDQDRDCVWCAVVETRGSTPQKAGAAMLVFADGSQRGTLGGGCVEAEVRQRALRVLGSSSQPEVLTFNLDDNYGWDDGLICGGRMSILAEPLTAHGPQADYYRRFRTLVESGQGCTEAAVIAPQPDLPPVGSRYLFDGQGQLAAQLADGPAPAVIVQHLVPVQQRPRPSVQHGVAYLPILPRITLLIVGGGHVGQAVAQLAATVDFDVWVLDDRERYVSAERFPVAQRRIVGDIGVTLQELARRDIHPSVYTVIVTRGHSHDEEALYHLAPTSAGYVGMIGSKRKKKLIYEDLVARGISAEVLAKVHSPLGFDIGSQTVPEIAVSIVAELIACRNVGKRRDPRDPITSRPSPDS